MVKRQLKVVNSWREEEDEPIMSEAEFLKELGDPCGLNVYFQGGKFSYDLGGQPGELFADHGIEVSGNRIDKFSAVRLQ